MAINTNQVQVATSPPVRIDPTKTGQMVPRGATVIRNRGDKPVFLGSKDVTVDTGFQVDAGEAFSADLGPGDALYAIAQSGTQVLHVLQTGGPT